MRDKTLRGYTAHVRLHLVLSPAASDTAVVYSLGIAAVILLITFGALAAYKSGLVHPTPPRHEASGP